MNDMKISDSVKFVGVNDHKIDLFEGQFSVPEGMSNNSYLILDEKIAVMDSVDRNFGEEWLKNIENVLSGKKPDFLVVQHMEMDHSANIAVFMKKYPDSKIVSSKMAFNLMKNMFGTDFSERQIVISEGSKVELGKHVLNFIAAPNVHWPEVMFTYESTEKILFSADGFGKFGALSLTQDADWACEARRYYFNIVGKYGIQVQALLKKAAALDIKTICPLHGPILTGDLTPYLSLYDTWSRYEPESKGVLVAYASIHGNTAVAAKMLGNMLKEAGVEKVVVSDLAREDMAEVIEDAFRYDRMVLCAASYDGGVFPCMHDFLSHLQMKGYKNRTIGMLENGSWGPTAARTMKGLIEPMKDITLVDPVVTIRSTMKDADLPAMKELAEAIANA